MSRVWFLVGLAAVGLAVVAAGLWTRPTARPDPSPVTAGQPAETTSTEALGLAFERFDGGVARLSDWRGSPMVVNFWASWCPPCVAEMRDALEPLHQQLGDDVVFVGLNLQDTPDRADATVEQTGVTYTLGRDPAGELFTAFGGFGMPTTVFIAADGTVVDSHTGAFTFDQLRSLVRSNLGV